jgi:hypothetical protein
MLQSIITQISDNFTDLKFLGLATTYKGKNYINGKPVLWEDNKGNYFYIVNRQLTFKSSKVKSGLIPVYEFDLYIYTSCNNDSVIPFYLIENMPKTIIVGGTIKFEEVKRGTAIIVKCSYEDNTGCNNSILCFICD